MINSTYDVQQLRQDYENIKKQYAAKYIVAASSLFLTTDIDPNTNFYELPLLENDARKPQKGDEIRLAQTDLFIFNRIAVGFVADLRIQDPEGQTDVEIGKSVFLQTLPYSKNADVLKAYKLFAGKMRVTINNVVYYEKYDLRGFDNSTIFTQINNTNGSMSSNDLFTTNVHRPIVEQPVQPMIKMSGAKKNEFRIDVPSSISPFIINVFDSNPAFRVILDIKRIGILLRGFLVQNGAEFNPAKS